MLVQSVGPSKTVQGKYGELIVYSIQIDNEWVELTQKPTTPPPTVGQNLEGSIETTQYGKRFKKAQNASYGGSNKDEVLVKEVLSKLDEILSLLKNEIYIPPKKQPDDNQPPASNYDL